MQKMTSAFVLLRFSFILETFKIYFCKVRFRRVACSSLQDSSATAAARKELQTGRNSHFGALPVLLNLVLKFYSRKGGHLANLSFGLQHLLLANAMGWGFLTFFFFFCCPYLFPVIHFFFFFVMQANSD